MQTSDQERSPIDRDNVRDLLWEQLPESRQVIAELESEARSEYAPEGELGVYSYISQALYWGVLVPAMNSENNAVAKKCFTLIEQMLASNDQVLKDCVGSRVTAKLFHDERWIRQARALAGDFLRADLAALTKDRTWLEE